MTGPSDDAISDLGRILLNTGCLKFGTFKLSSGIISPYYVDLRLIPSDPEAFKRVIALYSVKLRGHLLDQSSRFAGIPTAGLMFASVLAFTHRKPFLYVRKASKDYGEKRQIEGVISTGDRVLILDDVITSGSNIVIAVEAIRAEGGIVEDALVLLDRQQGGVTNLMRMGVKLVSFATISDVCRLLVAKGVIGQSQFNQIKEQITNA